MMMYPQLQNYPVFYDYFRYTVSGTVWFLSLLNNVCSLEESHSQESGHLSRHTIQGQQSSGAALSENTYEPNAPRLLESIGWISLSEQERTCLQFVDSQVLRSITTPTDMEKLLRLIQVIEVSERHNTLTSVATLATALGGLESYLALLGAIKDISRSERSDVINCARSLIDATMDVQARISIVNWLKDVSVRDRPYLVRFAQRAPSAERVPVLSYLHSLITAIADSNLRFILVHIINAIPDQERVNVLKNLQLLTEPTLSVPYIKSILDILTALERPERDQLCSKINSIGGKIDNPLLLWTLQFVPLDSIETFVRGFKSQSTMDVLTYFLLEIHKSSHFRDLLFDYWQHLFLQPTENRTRDLTGLILQSMDILGVFDLHPLVQEALFMQILVSNPHDPANPYYLYRRTLEKQQTPVNWSQIQPVIESVAGDRLKINPEYLRSIRQQAVHLSDLPAINPIFFEELDQRLASRLHSHPEIEVKIHNDFALSYSELRQGALGSPFLKNLLSIKVADDEPVPAVVSKLIAIASFLQRLDQECQEGQVLSLQEETFLKVLACIQNCVTGKEEGIHSYYANLPSAYKIAALEGNNSEIEKAKYWVNSIVLKEIEAVCSGTTLLFKRLLELEAAEDVPEPAHQARYIKNVLGPDIGLSSAVAFDRHSRALHPKLITKSKDEIMQAFYHHLRPRDVVNAILSAANAELEENSQLYNWFAPFIPEAGREEAWDINMEFGCVRLTFKGAIYVLKALRILEP